MNPTQGPWQDRRQGYRYPGFLFSEDGRRLIRDGVEYREIPFAAVAERRFRLWLIGVLALTFPGIPLLAYWGFHEQLFWIVVPLLALAYWGHQRIHRCPRCGAATRSHSVGRMGAPVLYLCERCRTYFEHGQIDGGLPWK